MDEYDDEFPHEVYAAKGRPRGQEVKPLLQVAGNKKGPSFDGSISWFTYEQQILDWIDVTELDEEKQGPELRNSLYGDAAKYKPLLDREALKQADGVEYFMKTLRPFYLKGVEQIFLWRFMNFLKMSRGNLDLQTWQTRLTIMTRRLMDAWGDLFEAPDRDQSSIDEIRANWNIDGAEDDPYFAELKKKLQKRKADERRKAKKKGKGGKDPADGDGDDDALPDPTDVELKDFLDEEDKKDHMEAFPLTDHIMSLLIVALSDLSNEQSSCRENCG